MYRVKQIARIDRLAPHLPLTTEDESTLRGIGDISAGLVAVERLPRDIQVVEVPTNRYRWDSHRHEYRFGQTQKGSYTYHILPRVVAGGVVDQRVVTRTDHRLLPANGEAH